MLKPYLNHLKEYLIYYKYIAIASLGSKILVKRSITKVEDINIFYRTL